MGRPNSLWFNDKLGQWGFKHRGVFHPCGKKRSEADKVFHRKMAALDKKSGVARDMTLSDLIDLWQSHLSAALSPKTRMRYHEISDNLRSTLGDVPAHGLKPSHVQKWLDANPGWKSSSTRHLHVTIAKLIGDFAEDEEYLDRNPFRKVKRPKMRRRKAAKKADVQSLYTMAGGPLRDFLEVAVETGCRPGELRTLAIDKIDWANATAEVKGKKGWRVVHLSPKALEVLRRCSEGRAGGMALLNTRGLPWSEKAIQSQFRRRGAKSGVRVVPYQTRGLFATEMIRSGVDSLVVSKLLGHESVTVLGKHYEDLQAEDLAKAVASKAEGDKG